VVRIEARQVEFRDGRVLLSTELLGLVFGITERAVRKWGANGCPQFARGRWDLKQVLEWRGLAGTTGDKESGEMTLAAQKLYYVDSAVTKNIEREIADTVMDVLNQMSVNGVYKPKRAGLPRRI